MKYSHIIYNSSEKNQSGAVGFGVRSSSAGTPPELISAMEENEVFSFAENGEPVTPSALASDPNLILRIVPTYFFRQVSLPDRSKYYVLGRKIAVGFDYTFYLNGKPGRLGNYVVDAYAFPEVPSAREFEILLEDPQSGSNRFIPASPVPTPDNYEMREISLGHNPTLPVSEKEFTTRAHIVPGKQAVDLLFTFIQSRKEDKPVLVKSDVATPPRLMAELAALMPQNQIENLTFTTNHSDEGKKRGVNIVFINEYYTFEIFKKQWVYLDLQANEMPQTPESALFRRTVEQYIADGNYDAIHKLVGWCLSSMYEKGKAFSRETQTQLYNYVYNYPAFEKNMQMLVTDTNLRDTLIDYWASNPEEKKRFDGSLQKWFDSLENHNGLWSWMEYILAVSPREGRKGIDCTKALDANRRTITSTVFEDDKTFEGFYHRFKDRFPSVQRFIDPSAYTDNDSYLTVMLPDWEALYPYFLGDKVRDHVYLMERMFADKVPGNVMGNVIKREIKNQEAYIATLLKILEKRNTATEYKVARMLAEELQHKGNVTIDFFRLFPDKLEDGYYTNLFTWQLRNSRPLDKQAINTLVDNILKFQSNDSATAWAAGSEGKGVFASILRVLKDGLKNKTMTPREVAVICSDLCASNYYEDARQFELLAIVANNANPGNDNRIASIWEIAKEVGDRKYLVDIFPHMASDLEKRDIKGLYSLCAFMIKNNLLTREQLTRHAKTTSLPDAYYVGILHWEEMKPQEQLDYLINETGKTDEKALALLERHFPESHAKILKSREPSVISKVSGFFKNMFAKKENQNGEDDSDESRSGKSDKKSDTPKDPASSKEEKGGGLRKIKKNKK